ncbi:MAG: hypothetical protein K8S54_14285 [Spirochaetia bacterium]|nr:hypothetical protein [Spirochaetia bacterium]
MVTMVCLIASIVISRFRWRTSSNLVRVFAIGSIGTIYTFWAAPDFRFGGFFVWVLLISSLLLLLASLRLPKSVSQMVVIAFLILWIWKMDALVPHAQDTGVSLTRLNRESSAELKSVRTPEGFDYFVPIHGDQCGNSPLPCAPRVIQLKLRNPQDIRDGFLPEAIQN